MDVNVKLMLVGGVTWPFQCDADDPILAGLVSALPGAAGQGGSPTDGLIQVRSRSSSLYVPRSSILAVEIEGLEAAVGTPPTQHPRSLPQVPSGMAVPAPMVLVQHPLPKELHSELLDQTIAREASFSVAGVSTGDDDYRRARVAFDFPLKARVEQMLMEHVRNSYALLDLPRPQRESLETHLTTSNDGDFYRAHNDSGSEQVADRLVTYVYYFHRRPKAFSGGELRLYDCRIEAGEWRASEGFRDVEPSDNSMVIFPSWVIHEILPVRCPTRAFGDGRFTVNGWIRGTG